MRKDSVAYAEHILDVFTEVFRRVAVNEPLKQAGEAITPSLSQALEFLYLHDVCPVRDIAGGLSMTYSAASQLTDRLVRKVLASRSENERDRRLSEIRLTERGRNLVEEIRRRRVAGMSVILDRMNPQSRRTLFQTMEEFIAASISDERSALAACSHCGTDHLAECVVNEMYQAATGEPMTGL